MGITRISLNKYKVLISYRTISGKIWHKQITLEGDRSQAQEAYSTLENELKAKDQAPRSLKSIINFGEALELYRKHKDVSHSSSVFNNLKEKLGDYPLSEIEVKFRQYFEECRLTLSNATCNRKLEWAKAILNHIVKLGFLNKNPLQHFIKLKEIPRDRMLSDAEIIKFEEALQKKAAYLLPLFQFALQVPCRLSELINMKKENLDLFNNIIRIPNGKTKNDQGIYKPIPPNLLNYFRTLPADTEYLFFRREKKKAVPLGQFQKAWRSACIEAKIQNFRLHDLRHISATRLIMLGNPDRVVMEIAGWKSDMLRIYFHQSGVNSAKSVRFSESVFLKKKKSTQMQTQSVPTSEKTG